jgi:hypothetical protein
MWTKEEEEGEATWEIMPELTEHGLLIKLQSLTQ